MIQESLAVGERGRGDLDGIVRTNPAKHISFDDGVVLLVAGGLHGVGGAFKRWCERSAQWFEVDRVDDEIHVDGFLIEQCSLKWVFGVHASGN